jgi:hypothetical protein
MTMRRLPIGQGVCASCGIGKLSALDMGTSVLLDGVVVGASVKSVLVQFLVLIKLTRRTHLFQVGRLW